MTSKHYKWQQRWRVAGRTATHETGLAVSLQAGQFVTANAAEVAAALGVKNGPHNAPRMVERLAREGQQLLSEAAADGT